MRLYAMRDTHQRALWVSGMTSSLRLESQNAGVVSGGGGWQLCPAFVLGVACARLCWWPLSLCQAERHFSLRCCADTVKASSTASHAAKNVFPYATSPVDIVVGAEQARAV